MLYSARRKLGKPLRPRCTQGLLGRSLYESIDSQVQDFVNHLAPQKEESHGLHTQSVLPRRMTTAYRQLQLLLSTKVVQGYLITRASRLAPERPAVTPLSLLVLYLGERSSSIETTSASHFDGSTSFQLAPTTLCIPSLCILALYQPDTS